MENIQEKERIKELEEEIESRKSKWDALCSTCDRLREENDNLQDKVLEGQRAIEALENILDVGRDNPSTFLWVARIGKIIEEWRRYEKLNR